MKNKAITSLLKRMLCLMLCVLLCPTYAVMAEDADVSLKLLAVNGSNLEFSQGTYDYDILLPYDCSESVDSALKLPDIIAIPTDSSANVTITPPDEAEGGTAVVTVENGGASQDYTITITGVGKNMYTNGGAESGDWPADYGSRTRVQGNAGKGEYSVLVTATHFTPDGENPYKTVNSGKKYLASSMVKANAGSGLTSAWADVYTPNGGVFGNRNSATFKCYDENGEAKANKNYSISETAWTTGYRVIDVTADTTIVDVFHDSKTYTAKNKLFDEVYLGDLVIGSIKLVDSNGFEIDTVELPEDGDTVLEFDEVISNQLGNPAGLENESITNSYLLEDYEGVTLSDGTLTINDSAELGDIVIVTELVPSFDNAVQDKVISAHKVTITEPVDRSGAQLADIIIGGLSVPNFSPKKLDYTFCVPYKYKPNDTNTFDIPEIKAIPKNSKSTVDVSTLKSVDGEEVVITVTSEDGEMQADYTVALTTVGGNMYDDGGFEKDGTWAAQGNSVLTRTQENPAAGEWAMLVTREKGTGYYGAKNKPKLKAGWRYITQSMLRGLPGSNPHNTTNNFDFSGGATKAEIIRYNENGGSQSSFKTSDAWQKAFAIITPEVDYNINNHFTNWGKEDPIVIDEYFVGELVISSMTYTGENIGLIPAQGEEPYKVKLRATYTNQFGTTIGFEKEKIEFELTEAVRGLSIEDGYLYVSDDAKIGTARVRAYVDPTYKNTQGKTAITAEISLTPSDSASELPQAKNVILDGIVEEGSTLVGDYDYYQISDTPEGESEYKWYSENLDGTGRIEIAENYGKTELYVTSTLAEKRIYFEVTPVAEDGSKGMTVVSDYLCKPMPPYAINVRIEGERYIGSVVSGLYDYVDPNSDEEDVPGAEFQWLIADNASDKPTPIDGANTDTYEIKSEDVDKYITFSVKPKAQNAPYVDEEKTFESDPVLAASTAKVKNLEIVEVNSNTYKVSYDYYHPTGITEGETEIKWTVDGSSSSTNNKTITVKKNTKKLKVTVIPFATKAPYEGDKASCEITISNGGGSSISVSGGGGGGGFAFVPMPEKVVEPPKEEVEVVKHWAEDGINFCKANGIMQDASQGNFGNLNIVTRAELVSYIIKALGEKEASYEYGFKDVAVTDYYAGALQRAVALGIISEAENFEPDRNVTREEVSKILVAAYGKEISEKADLTRFSDNASISGWATEWIAKSVSVGLLKGVSDNEFNPKGSITREQTAVLIKRLYDLRNGGIAK